MKKQRQGEADNPGPGNGEADSDGEVMPALIYEEDNEVETVHEEDDEEESDNEREWRGRTVGRDIARAETQTT